MAINGSERPFIAPIGEAYSKLEVCLKHFFYCEIVAGRKQDVYFDRKNLIWVGLDEDKLQLLRDTYKNIDVDQELDKMKIWLLSSKGKLRKGNLTFISYWLNNCRKPAPSPVSVCLPTPHLINKYLQELWKKSTPLHDFNTLS